MSKGTKKKNNKNQERYLVNIFVFVVTVYAAYKLIK